MVDIQFTGVDIGKPNIKGALQCIAEGFSITAGGEDIWNEKDQCHFGYMAVSGDFDIITRFASLSRADLYSKAGIMARETLNPDSKHVYLLTFPDNSLRNNNNGGIEFAYRSETGGKSLAVYPSTGISNPPVYPVCFPNTWLRLKRSKNIFDSYYSTDGMNWMEYASFEQLVTENLLLGLAVTSHNITEPVNSTVYDISIQ